MNDLKLRLSWLAMLSTALAPLAACDRSCSVYPWIVDGWIQEEDINEWVTEEGEFIGNCETFCREPPYDGTTDTCELLKLYDPNAELAYPPESAGGAPGRLPGMGGAAGEEQWGAWLLVVKCGSGEREYCPIEE